jgi:hypothetical protein
MTNETNGMTPWAWARFWLALVALVGVACGCKGPLQVHEESTISIFSFHIRNIDPRLTNTAEANAVKASASATIGSNNKAGIKP